MLSRRETSLGEAARAQREETRSKLARSLGNEFALRAGILRLGALASKPFSGNVVTHISPMVGAYGHREHHACRQDPDSKVLFRITSCGPGTSGIESA